MNQAAPQFASVLNKPTSEIKEPQAYPVGSYLCIVDGQPTFGESSQKKTPYAELAYKIIQPHSEIDLTNVGPEGIQGKIIKGQSTRFYLTESAVFMLVNHLQDDLGIDKTGKTPAEMLAEAPGKQVIVHLKHTPSQDGKRMYHEVSGYAKV